MHIKYQYKLNERIKHPVVRVVGDNVEEPGIYSIDEARKIASSLNLDLVEISANASPPVCRVIDFQKFIYQQKKKQKGN